MSLGLRGFHFFQHQNYAAPTLAAYYQRDVYGFGPKVGLGGRLPFRDPAWSVVGGANAALLLAQFTDSGNGQLGGSSYWMAVPQLDGEFGLNWRLPAPSAFSVTVGGRLAAWFNTSITFDGSYQTTWLEFGPFVRLAYNFGGRITPKSLAAPHVSPEATATANVVRFGFDETTIGPVATGVLRQAASDVSSGRPVNLSIRGMAEDGDTDHERRLAAQRAATVKEQLARLGVNERQIVLASRGEIPPLVAVPGVTAASTRVQIIY